MPNDATISALITELDGFANAPMTATERLTRAHQVLAAAGLSLDDLKQAVAQDAPLWKRSKAAAFGVAPEQWQRALDVVRITECADLGAFLDALHRAESAAAMLRAGYEATHDDTGNLEWAH